MQPEDEKEALLLEVEAEERCLLSDSGASSDSDSDDNRDEKQQKQQEQQKQKEQKRGSSSLSSSSSPSSSSSSSSSPANTCTPTPPPTTTTTTTTTATTKATSALSAAVGSLNHFIFGDLSDPGDFYPQFTPANTTAKSKSAASKSTRRAGSSRSKDAADAFPREIITGLWNYGNTCFMNSVVQALITLPPVVDFVVTCQSHFARAPADSVARSFSDLVLAMVEGNVQRATVQQLVRAVRANNLLYADFSQQDSQEFFHYILHELDEALGFPATKPRSHAHEEKKRVSLISKLFNGVFESRVRCHHCNAVSVQEEAFTDIAVELVAPKPAPKPTPKQQQEKPGAGSKQRSGTRKGVKKGASATTGQKDAVHASTSAKPPSSFISLLSPSSIASFFFRFISSFAHVAESELGLFSTFQSPLQLTNCLSSFWSDEEMSGDNKYHCDKCNSLRDATKCLRLKTFPEILCISLKRFKYKNGQSIKLDSAVEFPLRLYPHEITDGYDSDERASTAGRTNKGKTETDFYYALHAVVVHHGRANHGHYTAYVFNVDSARWFLCDDSRLYTVGVDTVLAAKPYALFYRKTFAHRKPRLALIKRYYAQDIKSGDDIVFMSKMWLSGFFSMVDPGPIHSNDVACEHGGILPFYDNLLHAVEPVQAELYNELASTFGGGRRIFSPVQCKTCFVEEVDMDHRRKLEWKNVITKPQRGKASKTRLFALSKRWFRKWESFCRSPFLSYAHPPGPIDNLDIVEKDTEGSAVATSPSSSHPVPEPSCTHMTSPATESRTTTSPALRATAKVNVHYIILPEASWSYLRDAYGGGPEVLIEQETSSDSDGDAHS